MRQILSTLVNALVKKYLTTRIKQIDRFVAAPHITQQKVLKQVVNKNINSLNKSARYSEFLKDIPLSKYETISSRVDQAMLQKNNTFTKEKLKWFAKSSGTTTGQSKYIPLTKSFLFNNHIRASWFAAALVYHDNPKATIFKNKNLLMGGSISAFPHNKNVMIGDISGFTISNIPAIGRPFYTPDFKTALITDWDLKIKKMVEICSKESLFLLAGVPTWTLVLFQQLLKHTGKNNILEIWPEAYVYMHGGIHFEPYRKQFEALLPDPDFFFMEIYNASEGAFAIQNEKNKDGMLLLLDAEIFYEFIPYNEIKDDNPSCIPLSEVEKEVQYAIVVSTTSGLMRYIIGDVVKFVSTDPYKIKVVGRTKEHINAFGEELMIENAELAVANACAALNIDISNYTVAPFYIGDKQKGKHQWFIEFKNDMVDTNQLARTLDDNLKKINSDYEAKRQSDLAVEQLEIIKLPKGTFEKWLRSKGKFGSQYKVPRLKNDRSVANEILELIRY